MIDWLREAILQLGSLGWKEGVFYWSLTLVLLISGEVYCAKRGRSTRGYYRRVFDPLHWMIAFGPFVLFFLFAFDRDGQEGEAIWILLAFLSFFGTVALLEKMHDLIWQKFRQAK